MVHLEALREETRLEIRLEELPGGVWLEAHWEVRVVAVAAVGSKHSEVSNSPNLGDLSG